MHQAPQCSLQHYQEAEQGSQHGFNACQAVAGPAVPQPQAVLRAQAAAAAASVQASPHTEQSVLRPLLPPALALTLPCESRAVQPALSQQSSSARCTCGLQSFVLLPLTPAPSVLSPTASCAFLQPALTFFPWACSRRSPSCNKTSSPSVLSPT